MKNGSLSGLLLGGSRPKSSRGHFNEIRFEIKMVLYAERISQGLLALSKLVERTAVVVLSSVVVKPSKMNSRVLKLLVYLNF